MAGYFLSSIDHDAFSQLTTAPTREQGLLLADYLMERIDEEASAMWPRDRDALADRIVHRLAQPDWYSDLSYEDACVWDDVVRALQDEPGERIGVDVRFSDYEAIYWDCAEIAAKQGATMMAEPTFGNSGFRYLGKPKTRYGLYPMYSLFLPERTAQLLAQLERVEPHFRKLPGGEESPREQFFECLLPAVREAAGAGRILWVQTDT